jgi:hypothetical protein
MTTPAPVINTKAVDAINKANQNTQIPADEAEALIAAVDACSKGEPGLLPHVLLRGVAAVPAAVANNENLAGKALLALVSTLTSTPTATNATNGTDALRQAAIESLAGVASKSGSKQADVTREVSDILLQVSLQGSGFSEQIRKVAKEQVTKKLIESCPKGVVGKMLHWLSDDREDDTVEQIEAERKLALNILQLPALSRAPALTQLQQDEQIPKIAARVLSVVSANQFYRLLPIIANFVSGTEASAVAVVDAVTGAKCDTEKNWESLYALFRHLPKGLKTDTPFDKLSAIVSKKTVLEQSSDEVLMKLLKAFASASQLASNDVASKKVGVAKDLLTKILKHKEYSTNYSIIEAALLAFASLIRDDESAKTNVDDALAKSLSTLITEEISPAFDKYVYAVKKEGRQNAKPIYLTTLAVLENLKTVGSKIAEKQHISQAGILFSWNNAKKSLPVVASGAKGAFQRAIETAAASSATTGMIRQRD